MIELTEKQTKTVHDNTPMMHEIHRAQLINAIEQAINGTWSTARLKESQAWGRIPENHKIELSHAVDSWVYRSAGGKGTDTPEAIQSFYKNYHTETTPILPTRFVI